MHHHYYAQNEDCNCREGAFEHINDNGRSFNQVGRFFIISAVFRAIFIVLKILYLFFYMSPFLRYGLKATIENIQYDD